MDVHKTLLPLIMRIGEVERVELSAPVDLHDGSKPGTATKWNEQLRKRTEVVIEVGLADAG